MTDFSSSPQTLLTIAGFDPSGGAGLSLDLKVFQHAGFHGVGIITSATAQNTTRISGIHTPPPDFFYLQYQTLKEDFIFAGIKVGMVGSQAIITPVARILSENQGIPKIIDPVLRSTSGTPLFPEKSLPSYLQAVKGKISLMTPNLKEAEWITGNTISSLNDMRENARKIAGMLESPCLIKGGNFEGKIRDVLYDGKEFFIFSQIPLNRRVHGTGCFLSSAILVQLAQGKSLPDACKTAVEQTKKNKCAAAAIGKGQDIMVDII
jgi:hydroxymethylpyrimidine kinase/phosphomethylpyrimidine kinase